jgi:hypothetical protein
VNVASKCSLVSTEIDIAGQITAVGFGTGRKNITRKERVRILIFSNSGLETTNT